MDAIVPLNIAGGLAQTSMQQRQVAAAQDAAANRAQRVAMRLRKKHEEDAESVEDASEAADDHEKVEDHPGSNRGRNDQSRRDDPDAQENHLDIQA